MKERITVTSPLLPNLDEFKNYLDGYMEKEVVDK